jgi:hypothetical protein
VMAAPPLYPKGTPSTVLSPLRVIRHAAKAMTVDGGAHAPTTATKPAVAAPAVAVGPRVAGGRGSEN